MSAISQGSNTCYCLFWQMNSIHWSTSDTVLLKCLSHGISTIWAPTTVWLWPCRLLQKALKGWIAHWQLSVLSKLLATVVHALKEHAEQRRAKYASWRAAMQHRTRTVFRAFCRCNALLSHCCDCAVHAGLDVMPDALNGISCCAHLANMTSIMAMDM